MFVKKLINKEDIGKIFLTELRFINPNDLKNKFIN